MLRVSQRTVAARSILVTPRHMAQASTQQTVVSMPQNGPARLSASGSSHEALYLPTSAVAIRIPTIGVYLWLGSLEAATLTNTSKINKSCSISPSAVNGQVKSGVKTLSAHQKQRRVKTLCRTILLHLRIPTGASTR